MKCKRNIQTQEIYKWKAHLNIHGGQQELGEDYFEAYSPVVMSSTVRLLMIISLLKRWQSRQIDLIMAYPQDPIEFDMYIELPHGIVTKYDNGKADVLRLRKHLYG